VRALGVKCQGTEGAFAVLSRSGQVDERGSATVEFYIG